jgi:ribosomal protein L35
MYFLKTKKSALKRIQKKKNFLQRKKAYKAHLCLSKSSKRLRSLSLLTKISPQDLGICLKILPYI